jgi:hypothetical protein
MLAAPTGAWLAGLLLLQVFTGTIRNCSGMPGPGPSS